MIDLGVMVPSARILEAAREHDVDVVGLSGLITPSLDEMVAVAREMERAGLKLPLLIGGATTSKVHTAVKVAPQYSGATVHVLDASKSVPAVSALTSAEQRDGFLAQVSADLRDDARALRGPPASQTLLSLEDARANAQETDWEATDRPAPNRLGVFSATPSVAELREWIDWGPFFIAWEMRGASYPAILDDPDKGEAAQKLFDEHRRCSTRSSATACWSRAAPTACSPPTPTATTSCSTPPPRGMARAGR